jgi:uncharacterized protein (TIGR00369 family)
MENFNDNDYCFVCGNQNPNGLKLTFNYNQKLNQVESKVIFPKYLQGWEDVVHGGIISTILDEIMVKAVEMKELKCVTAEINVRFKKPAFINKTYRIVGRITDFKKRIILAEGSLLDEDDEDVIASAYSKLFIVD